MVMLLSLIGTICLPMVGGMRLFTAVGLHRHRRWARLVAIALSCLSLLGSLWTFPMSGGLALFELPGAVLAIATLAILFRKDYAALFRRTALSGDTHTA
jgi:hypothetical protein